MLWIHEGSTLNDAGTLLGTSYVDLREDGGRTAIPALVKGCRREHALEDGDTVLVSKPARFREFGEGLIRDEQEGFANEKSVTVVDETPAEGARRRAIADQNEAQELLDTSIRSVRSETRTTRNRGTRSIAYGKEWWVYCTSIMAEEKERESWRATLDDAYDHVSVIGQPAKFAQAQCHMVADQIGPQGKGGWSTGTNVGGESVRTKHKSQWVLHGPVVYTDQLYDLLARQEDEVHRLAAMLFAKSTEYAAQREYRFAIMNEGAGEETLLLKFSGMMRDALRPTEGGLIRPKPAAPDSGGENGSRTSSGITMSTTPRYKRSTVTKRQAEWEERRRDTKTGDGKLLSSDSERRESVKETIMTHDLEADGDEVSAGAFSEEDKVEASLEGSTPELVHLAQEDERSDNDEDAVKEIAGAENERTDPHGWHTLPVVHRGTGRVYRSFQEMFEDPGAPISPAEGTWKESACSPQEIVKTYGAVESLAMRIGRVKIENRKDAASACWHAMQCIRNIYARMGDIVDSLWIDRERFAVIRIKDSEKLGATGRIVISPGGSYAYSLRLPNREVAGYGGEEWGTMFFPPGGPEDSFEEFGSPRKQSDSEATASETGDDGSGAGMQGTGTAVE